MAEVFISYARQTQVEAHKVAEILRALAYEVWLDDQIPAHRAYAEVIEERLREAKAVVVIWSAEAVKSEWVRSEADRARLSHKLVQFSVDRAPLPMPFDQIQCADMNGWSGDSDAHGWRQVVAAIADLAGGAAARAADAAAASTPALPGKPSIALLPFANLSGDPDQEYFADGMVEEIAGALSRFKSLFVIGGASSLSLKAKHATARAAARTLGVRYILEGSVRRAGGRVRIAVKLLDGTDGEQIWADRFEDTLEDVFALQDRIALTVAGVIEPAVRAADMRRVAARPTDNLSSYDLRLRALSHFRTLDRANVSEALALLGRAIAVDPDNAQALAMAAVCHVFAVRHSWSDDPAEELAQARSLGSRALKSGPDDPDVLASVAIALTLDGDRVAAFTLADRAIELNPGSSIAWYASGMVRAVFGQPTLGFEHAETALRLDPFSPFRANILEMQGFSRFSEGRFGDAAALLRQQIQLRPETHMGRVFLAASYGHLGDLAAARETIRQFQSLTPIDIRAFARVYPESDVQARLLDGLERAPEPNVLDVRGQLQ